MKKRPENEPDMNKIQNIDIFEKSQYLHTDDDSYSFKGNSTITFWKNSSMLVLVLEKTVVRIKVV